MSHKHLLLFISLIATSVQIGAMEKTLSLVKTAVSTDQVLPNIVIYGADKETLLQLAMTGCLESGLEYSILTYQGRQNLDQAGFDALRRHFFHYLRSISLRQKPTKMALIIAEEKIHRQDALDRAVFHGILTMGARKSSTHMFIVLAENINSVDPSVLRRCHHVINVDLKE